MVQSLSKPNMKKSFYIIIAVVILKILFPTCGDGGTDSSSSKTRDYRQDMRDFIQHISTFAKGINSAFIIITQNGQELLTTNGEGTGTTVTDYVTALDGIGQEDLFYGYNNDNSATIAAERNYLITFLDTAKGQGIEVLVTDYCWTHSYMDDSYSRNASRGYISFAAEHRTLDNIPSYPLSPYNENTGNIGSLTDAKNFLYLIDPGKYNTKSDFLNSLQATNYDILLIDLFFNGGQLSSTDVNSLKIKNNGGTRLVIGYMSIGEAENYRYYWDSAWDTNPPSWLAEENPDWPGNYKVRYWQQEWQDIISGNVSSYLKKILDSSFDGVYLDIIDAFEYFENQ